MADKGNVLVTGAGGFIGHHLVSHLKTQGYWVRGVDLKYPDFSTHKADDFLLLDLRRQDDCFEATRNIDEIYTFAADTGGQGFLPSRKASASYNNLLITLHLLEATRARRVKRLLYASSLPSVVAPSPPLLHPPSINTTNALLLKQQMLLREQQVGEDVCLHYGIDYNIDTKVVRLPNIFGPYCPWDNEKERVPAALCRKIAAAKLTQSASFEIWGDGEQVRSFCYIDDCVSSLYEAMNSSHSISVVPSPYPPLTINQLADIIVRVAGIPVTKQYVPGPNPLELTPIHDATLPQVASKTASTSLEQALRATYTWIEERLQAHHGPSQDP